MTIPTNNIYSVKPFADRYSETNRQQRGNFDGWPCAICGRDVGDPKYGGIVTTDGKWTTDPNHPDSQGWFPVGPDCYRRFVIKEV